MRYFSFMILLALLSACAPQKRVSEVRADLDAKRKQVLENNKALSTEFIYLRTFHQGLMTVVGDKSQQPYKELDSIFNHAFGSTNSVLMLWMLGDEQYEHVLKVMGEKEKVRLTKQLNYEIALTDSFYLATFSAFESNKTLVHQDSLNYAQLCSQHGITRKDYFQMLELMGKRLYQFQDSLELQGFKLASCKRHLQSTGLTLGMPDFQPHYKIISEVELLHKQYQQLLIQLENSFARFESGNPEDMYYTGPFILPRVDITVYNELLAELTIEMQRFREMEKNYYDSYSKP